MLAESAQPHWDGIVGAMGALRIGLSRRRHTTMAEDESRKRSYASTHRAFAKDSL